MRLWLGGGLTALFLIAALAGALLNPDPFRYAVDARNLPLFSPGHVFGTDQFGRDIGVSTLGAAWYSLQAALVTAALTVAVGTLPALMLLRLLPQAARWVIAALTTLILLAAVAPIAFFAILAVIEPRATGSVLAVVTLSVPIALLLALHRRQIARAETTARTRWTGFWSRLLRLTLLRTYSIYPIFLTLIIPAALLPFSEVSLAGALVAAPFAMRLGLAAGTPADALNATARALPSGLAWLLLLLAGSSVMGLRSDRERPDLVTLAADLASIFPEKALLPAGCLVALVAGLVLVGDALRLRRPSASLHAEV